MSWNDASILVTEGKLDLYIYSCSAVFWSMKWYLLAVEIILCRECKFDSNLIFV